jgi:hypothetical protein
VAESAASLRGNGPPHCWPEASLSLRPKLPPCSAAGYGAHIPQGSRLIVEEVAALAAAASVVLVLALPIDEASALVQVPLLARSALPAEGVRTAVLVLSVSSDMMLSDPSYTGLDIAKLLMWRGSAGAASSAVGGGFPTP